MDAAFEIDVVQNEVLATELLWHAVSECSKQSDGLKGMSLHSTFLILPIAMHLRSANALAKRTGKGAFLRTVAENRDFSVGLQQRMEALSGRTLAALNLGFAARLLTFEQTRLQVFSSRQTPTARHVDGEISVSMTAAKRLGQAVAELEFPQLITILGVRF